MYTCGLQILLSLWSKKFQQFIQTPTLETEKVPLLGVTSHAMDWRALSHSVQNISISPSPSPKMMLQVFYAEMVSDNCC